MIEKFSSISPSRLMIYFILLSFIPIIFIGYRFLEHQTSIRRLHEKIESVKELHHLKEARQAVNLSVKEHYLNADHFYIDKHVETIELLSQEKENLRKILDQQHLVENEAAKKRLDYLEVSNRISFSEGIVQSYPYFHETTETLIKPIEANQEDVSLILSRIEGVEMNEFQPGPNRPQLIVTDFRLEKKSTGDRNQVFQINMKLLKREFF
ncbi:MAG: hypothetical protein Tsb0021_02630 [Chlamydiales bacterium]